MFSKMFHQSLRDLCANPCTNITHQFGIVSCVINPLISHSVILKEFSSGCIWQPLCSIALAFHRTINEPSCIAWWRLCQKVNLQSYLAQPAFYNKVNLSSYQSRQSLCHKVNLPHCVVQWSLCHKLNLPSSKAWQP